MSKSNKIELISLGCSKNTVDSERIMNQLKLNNYEFVESSEDADSIIINTCGFIDAAKEESVNTILEAIELKKQGKIKKIVVAGCLSERYLEDLKKELPEVDSFFGTENYEGIVKDFNGDLKENLLGERTLTTPSHYAYLKISEGCDNPCSFCAIPLIRGGHVSVPIEKLVDETKRLASQGVKELVIIGQDTTEYGKDIYGKRNLAELLQKISEVEGIQWIRLLYAYPSHFPTDIMDVIASNDKVLTYIDIPFQHVADNVLKSMRRGITKRRTIELINTLRERIPNLTLRTTFIVGYPNETGEDFKELCDFIKEVKFERVGVFPYSIEENTPSFILGDPLTEEEKEERKNIVMEIQKEISEAKNAELVGKTVKVIIDEEQDEFYIGRTERDTPEVDGEVVIPKSEGKLSVGEIYSIEITDYNEYDLEGKIS